MYKLLSTDDISTLAQDMYEHISESMDSRDVNIWLEQILQVSAAHMNACGEDQDNIDEVDESFLMYENAFLYLLGMVKHYGLLEHSEHSSSELH